MESRSAHWLYRYAAVYNPMEFLTLRKGLQPRVSPASRHVIQQRTWHPLQHAVGRVLYGKRGNIDMSHCCFVDPASLTKAVAWATC